MSVVIKQLGVSTVIPNREYTYAYWAKIVFIFMNYRQKLLFSNLKFLFRIHVLMISLKILLADQIAVSFH